MLLPQSLQGTLLMLILFVGWPVLFVMSYFIIRRGRSYAQKLKKTVVGKLMKPTIAGWIFGLYALGIVATAYMIGIPWLLIVPPVFAIFLVMIVIIYRAMAGWEREATEMHKFYENLERLVKDRTKKLEEAHKLSIAHEKEIQKLKDQFVFIAAHELKTPVTAIRWSIENVMTAKKKLPPDLMDMLNTVQLSNQRLITLVDDLLNVARIEAGTIKISSRNIDINAIIKQTLAEMHSVFSEKKLTVEYVPKKSTAWADPERVKQVLINLLSNATKYNKQKGKIVVSLQEKENMVCVSISDTGIGIQHSDMQILFTKFGRIKNEKTMESEGTGLGLFLSKELVVAMHGQIDVKSTVGEGSTFSFTLPMKQKK